MPYRRLPNTDNARIRALRQAIEKGYTAEGKEVVQTDIFKLQGLLRNFESAQTSYQLALKTQVDASKKFQTFGKSARLYVSHFIQVLNMCVIRKEIKESMKLLYGLSTDEHTVPELNTNESLLEWGDKTIRGEQNRLVEGGIPIYNPSIARVKVEFSKFKEAFVTQKLHQTNTQRQLDALSVQRADIDEVLRETWNQIEVYFENLPREEKLDKCKSYGVIYYVRKKKNQEENSEYN